MRVFVYEYMTALGIGRAPESPEHGMYREGRAMRDAVAEDLRRIEGAEVVVCPEGADGPVPCGAGWWHLFIAPETDGVLAGLAEPRSGGFLLGSSGEALRLTSDKLALADHWRGCGVRTPATSAREPTPCEAFPVVWKPRDGAGSTDTFLIRDRFELASALAVRDPNRQMILQEFVPGRAASVAFLCGPREQIPLVPTLQTLSGDGRFKYEGGELPIPTELAERAVAVGRAAVGCVPGLVGYVGVDVVLGAAPDGSDDRAIEINPRLTTSYIGLRALADFNIAEVMLRVAAGGAAGALRWKPGRVRFGPDGSVRVGA